MSVPFVNFHTHRSSKEGEIVPFSAGLHPWDIDFEQYPTQLFAVFNALKDVLNGTEYPKLTSPLNEWKPLVGECGWDNCKTQTADLQPEIFHQQAVFAKKHALPMILHCVKAFDALWSAHKTIMPDQSWIIHGFRASKSILQEMYKRNIYASFGEAILPSQSPAAIALQTLPKTAVFFLETDISSVAIEDIYARAADLRAVSVAELKQQQWEWTQHLLRKN